MVASCTIMYIAIVLAMFFYFYDNGGRLMRKGMKQLALLLALAVAFNFTIGSITTSAAKKKIKLNQTSVTMTAGKTAKLQVSGAKGKITWT